MITQGVKKNYFLLLTLGVVYAIIILVGKFILENGKN